MGGVSNIFSQKLFEIYKKEGGVLIQNSLIIWDIKWLGGESNIPAKILFEA